MRPPDVFVENETIVVTGTEFGLDDTSAVLQWSLRRTVSNRRPTVKVLSGGSDASIIGFDLRIDLLTDPTATEVTRGMEIELASYQPLSCQAHRLRAEVTRQLFERVVDFAYQPPKSKY